VICIPIGKDGFIHVVVIGSPDFSVGSKSFFWAFESPFFFDSG